MNLSASFCQVVCLIHKQGKRAHPWRFLTVNEVQTCCRVEGIMVIPDEYVHPWCQIQSQRVWAKLMLIGKLLEGFRAEVLDAFFKGMNPRRMQSIKISYASGASIGITGLTLEEACFLLSGKGDGSKLPSTVSQSLQRTFKGPLSRSSCRDDQALGNLPMW